MAYETPNPLKQSSSLDQEDQKTFIPGVGLLITSWDGSESRLIPIAELAGGIVLGEHEIK
jgi:hypothetical protein